MHGPPYAGAPPAAPHDRASFILLADQAPSITDASVIRSPTALAMQCAGTFALATAPDAAAWANYTPVPQQPISDPGIVEIVDAVFKGGAWPEPTNEPGQPSTAPAAPPAEGDPADRPADAPPPGPVLWDV